MAAIWTNLFDLGECTVKVLDLFELEHFSQIMGKGDSATFDVDLFPDPIVTVTVSVDAAGLVSVDGDSLDLYDRVLVVPSYAHDYPARIRTASTEFIDSGEIDAYGAINNTAIVPSETLGVDCAAFSTPSPGAPDPLDMSSLTGARDCVGIIASGSF